MAADGDIETLEEGNILRRQCVLCAVHTLCGRCGAGGWVGG